MNFQISTPASLPLPTGYRHGAHVSGEGWSGYYVIRTHDGASCVAAERPDYDEAVTAEALDAAIAKIKVGDWIVGGTDAEGLDFGRILALDEMRASIGWSSGQRTDDEDLECDDIEVFNTKAQAEARHAERLAELS